MFHELWYTVIRMCKDAEERVSGAHASTAGSKRGGIQAGQGGRVDMRPIRPVGWQDTHGVLDGGNEDTAAG